MPICAFKLASNSTYILVLYHILIMLGLLYMSPVVLFGLLAVFLLIIIQIQVGFIIPCTPTSSLGAIVTFYGSGCLHYQYFTSILLSLSIFGYCLTLLEPALGRLVYMQPLCACFQDSVSVSSLVVRSKDWS